MPAATTAAAAANKHIPSSRKDDPSPRPRQPERPSDKGLDSKGTRRPDGPAVHGSAPAPDRLARVGSGALPHTTTSPSKPLPDPETQRSQHGKRKATAAPGDGDLPDSPEAGHRDRRGSKEKSKGKDKSQKEDKRDRHDKDRDAGKQTDAARESVQVKTEASIQDRDVNKERDMPRDIPRDIPRDNSRDNPRDTPRDLPRDATRESPRDNTRDRDGKRSKDKDGRHHQSRSKGDADMPPPAAGGGGEATRQAEREDRLAVEPQRTTDNEGRRESRTSVKEEAVAGEQHRETKHGRSAPAVAEADTLTRERCVF